MSWCPCLNTLRRSAPRRNYARQSAVARCTTMLQLKNANILRSSEAPHKSRCCCRKVTSLRDGHSVPPTDSLLRFLVESSSDEFPSCANCDRNEKSPMFFCNTCGE